MSAYSQCEVCGEDIIHMDDAVSGTCSICGKACVTNFSCVNHHIVCSECRYAHLYKASVNLCLASTSKDPIEIAERLMSLPEFSIYGCNHYLVVPFALITAYSNAGGKVANLEQALENIYLRLLRYPSSMCKIGGVCGIPISAGVGLIDMLAERDTSYQPHRIANTMTTECLLITRKYMPNDDTFCCKRHVYLSILRGAKFIDDNFWIQLSLPDKVVCRFQNINKKCAHRNCVMAYGLITRPKT